MLRGIVHVTPYYPPHLGGVERVAHALAVRSARRFPVEVVTSFAPGDDAEIVDGGVTVRRLPAKEIAHTPLPVLRLLRRLFAIPRDTVVHVHVAHALWPELVSLASRVRGFRVVAHFHLDVDPSGRAGALLPYYKRFFLGPSLRRADAVIALTAAQADELRRTHGVAPERVHVIGNGVDESFTRLSRIRVQGAPLHVLFVGRLEHQKNVRRLIRATALVDAPVEVVIVGAGAEAEQCRTLCAELSLTNVTMVGAQFGQDLLDWYGWADVFALPSDREGMPLALLEAMAAGLAVVATDVSDLRAQVGDGGLVVDPDDDAFGAAMQRLAADPGLLEGLQKASRSQAARYGWDPIVTEVENLYETISR